MNHRKPCYVKAEMDILAWVNKPVIVLLNQMGEARPPEEEKAEVELGVII